MPFAVRTPLFPPLCKWLIVHFKGSVLIMEADSKEECIAGMKKDIYYRSGVWNVDDATVTPMKLAFIRP